MDPLQLAIIGIVIVVFVVMGPKKIPELARALGMARKEFSEGMKAEPTVAAAAAPTMGPAMASSGTLDELMMAAHKLGIATEGKTKEQIQDEIIRKTAGT
jgi:sec-independent protein translocase protein TatA